MAIDPGTAMLLGMGMQGISGLIGSGKGMSGKDRAEAQRQFDEQYRFQQEIGRGSQAMDQVGQLTDLQRQVEMLPLRDKVSFMLNQRAGMVPQNFQANDMMNPTATPQRGGIDTGALQGAADSYQMGQGGVDPRAYEALMSKLGWSQGPGGPSVGNIDIVEPHVEWGRAPNTRMHELREQELAQRRAGTWQPSSAASAPPPPQPGPGYQPPGGYKSSPGGGGQFSPWQNVRPDPRLPRPNMDPARRYG